MIEEQTLVDFYTPAQPALRPPGNLRGGGHFTVYRLEEFTADIKPSSVYSRKDFYKIVLTSGPLTYHDATQQRPLAAGQQALVFTATHRPYCWDMHGLPCRGYCCIFTADFIPVYAHLHPADLRVFAAGEQSFFYLTPAQAADFSALFERMLGEQEAANPYKYELLFHYVMTAIYEAQKLGPPAASRGTTAATRLADAFVDLLGRQFPIFSTAQRLELRTAQAFSDRLAVHVNYLNRILKEETGKTTTQLLAERLIQEARALLHHTDWSISQISYCLGFEEPTHFTRFFRRYAHCAPSELRQV